MRGQWERWNCRICYKENIGDILQKVKLNDPRHPDFLFSLERHRLQNRYGGQEDSRLWTRQESLKNHLKKKHDLSDQELEFQISRSKFKFKNVSVCSYCNHNELFHNWKAEESHLWNEHRDHCLDAPSKTRDIDIWKLMTQQLPVHEEWLKITQPQRSGYKHQEISWEPSVIERVRLQLECSRLSPTELARYAFRYSNHGAKGEKYNRAYQPFDHQLFRGKTYENGIGGNQSLALDQAHSDLIEENRLLRNSLQSSRSVKCHT